MQKTGITIEDEVLDCRGQLCPMPVIQAAKTMNALAKGKVLKLISSDPGSLADIPAWAEAAGHQLVSKEGNGKGPFTFCVRHG